MDSRVVDLPMSYNPTFVTLSSLKPFFFNGLQSGGALLGPWWSISLPDTFPTWRFCKYSITPSQEVGRIPPRQQRVGSDEAICSCNAGGGFCAVRHAQLSAHPFGCSRGKPWGHLSTCGESDTPAQALGGVGRFRFSHLWGGPGEGWQCHQDRPSQLGSALWRHLPGQERTEVRWALAAMVRTGL